MKSRPHDPSLCDYLMLEERMVGADSVIRPVWGSAGCEAGDFEGDEITLRDSHVRHTLHGAPLSYTTRAPKR